MTQAELIQKIPKMAQRQDSVTEQMADLEQVAIALGMQDAADWIKRNFFQIKHISKS